MNRLLADFVLANVDGSLILKFSFQQFKRTLFFGSRKEDIRKIVSAKFMECLVRPRPRDGYFIGRMHFEQEQAGPVGEISGLFQQLFANIMQHLTGHFEVAVAIKIMAQPEKAHGHGRIG